MISGDGYTEKACIQTFRLSYCTSRMGRTFNVSKNNVLLASLKNTTLRLNMIEISYNNPYTAYVSMFKDVYFSEFLGHIFVESRFNKMLPLVDNDLEPYLIHI